MIESSNITTYKKRRLHSTAKISVLCALLGWSFCLFSLDEYYYEYHVEDLIRMIPLHRYFVFVPPVAWLLSIFTGAIFLFRFRKKSDHSMWKKIVGITVITSIYPYAYLLASLILEAFIEYLIME